MACYNFYESNREQHRIMTDDIIDGNKKTVYCITIIIYIYVFSCFKSQNFIHEHCKYNFLKFYQFLSKMCLFLHN